jgi:excisionase family DNA binding protein
MEENSNILTVEEVAEILRVHRVTVGKLLAKGELKGFKVGLAWRVKRESLEEFMDGEK